MTSRKCVGCGRTFAADVATKFSCCGQPIRVDGNSRNQVAAKASPRISRVTRAIAACVKCEHYRTSDGRSGCGLYKGTLCKSMSLIADGEGCHDHANPRFDPDWVTDHHFYGPWITYEELRRDIADFASRLSVMQLDAIAGVPRSGMMVASELAVRLGLPLYSLEESGLHRLATGLRLRNVELKAGKLLVMEDSTASGTSINEAKQWLGDRPNTLFGAIYSTTQALAGIDLHHRTLELAHWFEWNLLGNPNLMNTIPIGTDFDGVLCPDFTPEEDDDGLRYRMRIIEMPCIRHPGVAELPYIITARLEKYRELTEQWLAERRIKYRRLVMGPWRTQQERSMVDVGEWKANRCREFGLDIFIESCSVQAKRIANVARGVAVVCPEAKTTFIRDRVSVGV
ncbi:Phosphoribosyl transferase domain protein [Stieleria magnilauensis]|uniref:Phosphoribosyl transferase domain protein n=2 Tax=Stieleria magnilauensis TaxID=2527963 RepID=A0ABX5XSL5_9BACT|nr:Phosphoribosyl transferase domain protein [Planctomycetes bacterium TBK1r]